jgi:uncharacterized protein (DUF1330 family)
MANGYWVALVDASDPDGYKAYMVENATALRKLAAAFWREAGNEATPRMIKENDGAASAI